MNPKYNLYESFEKKVEDKSQLKLSPTQEQKSIIITESKKFKKQQKIAFLRLVFEHARIAIGWDGTYNNLDTNNENIENETKIRDPEIKKNALPYGLTTSGIKNVELDLEKIPPELLWILIEFCDVCATKL